MSKKLIMMVIAAISIVAVACSSSEDPTPTLTSAPAPTATPVAQAEAQTIVDIAVADGRFDTLVAAVTAADLATTLSGDGPFTVFAPTDDAFAALPEGTVDGLLADIPALTNILTYHVVSGSVLAADVAGLSSAPTLQGTDVSVRVENGNVFINDSQVILTDIIGSNGVIHVIDAVLLPTADEPAPEVTPTPAPEVADTIVDVAVGDGRFTTLVAALTAADLAGTLSGEGPFTVFAPTDDAFAALPAGIVEGLLADIPALTNVLTYHVVSGKVLAADVVSLSSAATLQGQDVSVRVENGNVFINDSQVIITDIVGSNGVIHVIDAVLLPAAEESTGMPVDMPTDTIVDIAVADGRFTTLVAALTAAGLAGTLSGDGPFTVFAPTDHAFAALPAGTVEGLLADIPALTNVLTYHVVSGKVLAADVVSLSSASTLQGQDVSVRVENGNVFINDSQVIITDIEGSNGVIHVIDAVLIPEAEQVQNAPAEVPDNSITGIAAADGRFTTLVAALQAAGLDSVLAGEGPFTVFAPTDAAFARLDAGTVEALLNDIPALTNILTYHVVAGEVDAATALTLDLAPTLQGSNIVVDNQLGNVVLNRDSLVTQADIQASNGVIHVVNRVLLPPAPKVQAPAEVPSNTIVDIAVADGRFTTLVAALTAADLVETLSGEGSFTVFAPTDAAFAALPPGTAEALLADIPALTDVLLYHVVSGNVLAADVETLTSATTLQGTDVTVRVENGNVFINDAQVIIIDIVGDNGVIHVIDMVLIP